MTQVLGELIRDLSDSMILPLDVISFSDYISRESEKILATNADIMRINNMTADIGESIRASLVVLKTAAMKRMKKYFIHHSMHA